MLNDTHAEDSEDELLWVKPRGPRSRYELRQSATVVATLSWIHGSDVLAQWGDTRYQFSRQGWLRPRILVHEAPSGASGEPLATMDRRSGTLMLPDGRTFAWKKPRRFAREHIWVDSAGAELARFRPARRSDVAVATQAHAVPQPELPLLILLILLGQYLIVLAAQDAENASTAAVVAVVASS